MLGLNKVYNMDCIEGMRLIDDNSIDSIVTDPPYELGFMGKSWDNTGISNNKEMWAECLRILKPGGYLLSFGGTRTYHRMACAIEDAGFEVRDMIEWCYGSGFPKSLNIGKAVDKHGGQSVGWFGKRILDWRKKNNITLKQLSIAIIDLCKNEASAITTINNRELNKNLPTASQFTRIIKEFNLPFNNLEEVRREIIGINDNCGTINSGGKSIFGIGAVGKEVDITKGTSEREGRGTALKPAHEPICMARKPLESKTVAENCVKYGTGGINIDESRVGTEERNNPQAGFVRRGRTDEEVFGGVDRNKPEGELTVSGRFPANLILSWQEDEYMLKLDVSVEDLIKLKQYYERP